MIEVNAITSESRYGIKEGDICYDENVFEPPLILVTRTVVREDPKLGDFYYGIYADGEPCKGSLNSLKKTKKSFPRVINLLRDLNAYQCEWYDS